VVHVDREGILVDVGTKSEGLVPYTELARRREDRTSDAVSVGDKIDVYVLQADDDEQGLLLSKKRADFERAWEKILAAHADGSTIHAMVTDRVKGGLVVDLGLRGFVPASHSGVGRVHNLDKLVGQSLPLKVIEVDRERRKVILSHRLALEQERTAQREKTLATIAEGQVRDGIVRRITNYGAFVDLGGIDGLLHISEMSWTRIGHPSDVVRVGDKIQVVVLKLNLSEGKISLGMRQILPDPWSEVEEHFSVGDIVPGRVTRLVPFGAFVQLETGIEGIVPNIELAEHRVTKPEQVVAVDDKVNVKILDANPEERRMTLSLREAPQPEPRPKRPRPERKATKEETEEPPAGTEARQVPEGKEQAEGAEPVLTEPDAAEVPGDDEPEASEEEVPGSEEDETPKAGAQTEAEPPPAQEGDESPEAIEDTQAP
jgi:ribosomal protein S1